MGYVPLFPLGRIRIVGNCRTCKRFFRFALNGRRRKEAIEKQRGNALSRVGQDVAQTLDDLAGLLHLGDLEGAELLLESLATKDASLHALVEARFWALREDADRAEAGFQAALQADSSSGLPEYWFGRFLLMQGRDAEAVEIFQQAFAHDVRHEYLGVLADFVLVRQQQKNWAGLATIMSEMVRREPDRTENRWFAKLYTKACRKTGQVPELANPYTQG